MAWNAIDQEIREDVFESLMEGDRDKEPLPTMPRTSKTNVVAVTDDTDMPLFCLSD